jgi:hypothetical protein
VDCEHLVSNDCGLAAAVQKQGGGAADVKTRENSLQINSASGVFSIAFPRKRRATEIGAVVVD